MSKILIAEDDDDCGRLLEMLLEGTGYETIRVCNGAAAIDHIVRDSAIEVALLDWMMGDISGIQVVQDVRALVTDRYVYLIMVTALSSRANVKTAVDAGADDYVMKPFAPEEIISRVKSGTIFATLKNEIGQRLKKVDNDFDVIKNKL